MYGEPRSAPIITWKSDENDEYCGPLIDSTQTLPPGLFADIIGSLRNDELPLNELDLKELLQKHYTRDRLPCAYNSYPSLTPKLKKALLQLQTVEPAVSKSPTKMSGAVLGFSSEPSLPPVTNTSFSPSESSSQAIGKRAVGIGSVDVSSLVGQGCLSDV